MRFARPSVHSTIACIGAPKVGRLRVHRSHAITTHEARGSRGKSFDTAFLASRRAARSRWRRRRRGQRRGPAASHTEAEAPNTSYEARHND